MTWPSAGWSRSCWRTAGTGSCPGSFRVGLLNFFTDGDIRSARAHVKTAKLICRGCPVSATCLSWALASGQEAGIWGGLTEDERRRLHRGRGFRPAQIH